MGEKLEGPQARAMAGTAPAPSEREAGGRSSSEALRAKGRIRMEPLAQPFLSNGSKKCSPSENSTFSPQDPPRQRPI